MELAFVLNHYISKKTDNNYLEKIKKNISEFILKISKKYINKKL
jgi:hypothetical protein